MQFIRRFDEIGINDIALVGGKNASLGEMYHKLTRQGIRVPDGFAITTDAYRYFVHHNQLENRIDAIAKGIGKEGLEALQSAAATARQVILESIFPDDLRLAIIDAYRKLAQGYQGTLHVAVRSSATAEDLPSASFAGQQETFLNIAGEESLLEHCKRCFASLFTDRALSYRADKAIRDEKMALSVGVQHMVRSDLATSGVIFTLDTETGFRNVVLINASYGLGESIVKGAVVPDEYYVFKPTLHGDFVPIIQRVLGSKETKLVYELNGPGVKSIDVSQAERDRFSLNDDDILTLAKWACIIESHYSQKQDTPMDIEWGKDGISGELFILQARPETVQAQKSKRTLERYQLSEKGKVWVTGRRVGERIGQGVARIIEHAEDLKKLMPGEVLVSDQTDPDWEPAMKHAAAIVTNRGGRTCHAAIVARELGIPAIVGAENATKIIPSGRPVTVSCAEGEIGFVYEGLLKYQREQINLVDLPRPKTKVMMILGNPHEAFRLSFIPSDGIGLAREEFIVSSAIGIHPMALVKYPHLQDKDAIAKIESLTKGYQDKPQFFIDQLAQGVAMIAAAFFPNDVIVRFSDFKTNEYANLIGGREFEPQEENPMLGFRGASRYYDERFRDAFALECKAMKKVREQMGLTNVKLMVPFCRTVDEGRRVLAQMEKWGLRRGEKDLEVYVMCEIPSNVILADEFADIFDGFSIGSNDLTQLILGVDRDSEILASIFDERNPAIKSMIKDVVATAKKKGKKIGICGQAPSDYPEFAEFLVELDIDSIALNPDAFLKTLFTISEAEKRRGEFQ